MKKNNIKLIIVIIILLEVAYLLGLWGIVEQIEHSKPKLDETSLPLIYVLALENLLVQIPIEYSNIKVVTAQFISHITLYLAVVFALFKEWITSRRLRNLSRDEHTLVIGLGENNRTYLESELNSPSHGNFIIIESDVSNIHAKHFREKGIGVFWGTLDEYTVRFKHLHRVVISTGNDRQNIEIVGKLIGMIPPDMTKKFFGCRTVIHVHLENQNYKTLFQQKILNSRKDLPLEFKLYSFNDDTARTLFEKHTILGNYHALAKTDQPYCTVVVGNGDLAERIIYHMCMQANLPNKNILTIHCVCEDAPAFLARIRSNFTGIDSISAVRLEGHSLHMDTPEFFGSDVWRFPNLSNVFVCQDDENINIECTVNLHDKVYLEEAVQNTMKTKVHFAMYHNLELGRTINENREEFKDFYTFGDAKEICDRKHLIDETYESIAKLIHYGYSEVYDPNDIIDFNDLEKVHKINDKWLDSTKFSDRESNRSQALHINTKLMSLGLKKVKVYELADLDKDKVKKLLDKNNQALTCDSKEFQKELNTDQLIELSCELGKLYSNPKGKLDEKLIEHWFNELIQGKSNFSRLMNAEHERWNAFHYLNGWKYGKEKIKETKKHNCLIPLNKFNEAKIQMTIVYDLYSILYLPNYLASTGYRIVPIEDVSIGVTGHRNIDMNDKKLNECLQNELQKVIDSYGNIELISPLAEGADRLFVDLAIKVDTQKIRKLTVPMPFEKKDYKQDFKDDESKNQFESFLSQDGMSIDVYSLSEVKERLQVFIDNFIQHAYTYEDDLFNSVEKEDYDHIYKVLEWMYKIASNLDGVKNEIPSLPNMKCPKSKERIHTYLELFYEKISELETKDLQKEFYDKQYEKTGREVVDKSDILFAIWDGEKAIGRGGTAEIVKYSVSKGKKIIWINPITKKVSYHIKYVYPCEIEWKSLHE